MTELAEHAQRLSERLRFKTYDLTDLPTARTWHAQRDRVLEYVKENNIPIGTIFISFLKHPKGYWVSEWSVAGTRDDRKLAERRGANKPTVESAIQAMSIQAGYARPPRKKLFARKKDDV